MEKAIGLFDPMAFVLVAAYAAVGYTISCNSLAKRCLPRAEEVMPRIAASIRPASGVAALVVASASPSQWRPNIGQVLEVTKVGWLPPNRVHVGYASRLIAEMRLA